MQKIFNKDGFNWWIGVVEDRMDPEQMGRVRVRIYGYHTDSKVILPTKDLPWAVPILPITSASTSGVGSTPLGPVTGTWVIGFFLDGEDMQQPAIFGTIGTNTASLVFGEPPTVSEVTNTNDGYLKDKDGNTVYDENGNPVPSGVPPVEGWELGKTSERYESGGRGPGTINGYASSEDRGGASYGTYQFASYLPEVTPKGKSRPSSKNSPVLSYLRTSKFRDMFEGLTPGTAAFDSKWTSIASSQKDAFQKDQHEYVKKNYYDVMSANLQRVGLDLTKFGPAVQDLVWSTAVQFGPGRTDVFTVPLRGKTQLTDKDIVDIVSQYKIANAPKFFQSSGSDIIASVQTRYQSEKTSLNNLITV
jgi:Gp5 N-terminal OB domain